MARKRITSLLDQLEKASGLVWHYDTTGGGCTALQTRRDPFSGCILVITHKEMECSVNEVEGHAFTHPDHEVIADTAGEWLLGTYAMSEDDDLVGDPKPLQFKNWGALIHALSY